LFKAYLAEFLISRGNLDLALNSAEAAYAQDPDLGITALVLTRTLVSLALESAAKEVLDLSLGSNLPTANHYVDRGLVYTHFGNYENALSDLNEAIRIWQDSTTPAPRLTRSWATLNPPWKILVLRSTLNLPLASILGTEASYMIFLVNLNALHLTLKLPVL